MKKETSRYQLNITIGRTEDFSDFICVTKFSKFTNLDKFTNLENDKNLENKLEIYSYVLNFKKNKLENFENFQNIKKAWCENLIVVMNNCTKLSFN